MSKRVLSLLLALCMLSGCTKAEEAPVEIPQEPMQETQSQEKEESEKPKLTVPDVNRDTEITDEIVHDLLIFLGAYDCGDGTMNMVDLFDPLEAEWSSNRMTAVCYNWYQMKMKRQHTVAELNEKYTGPNGREYNDDWYYPADEFIPEAEKYFDLSAVNLRSNEFYYHEDTDCFVFLGDRGSFDNRVTIDGWERFEDKLQIYLTFSSTIEELDMKPYQTVLAVRLEHNGFRYMSHQRVAPQVDKSTIYRILAILTENKDGSYLEIKDWKQIDKVLYVDLYDELLEQDSRLTAVYHEDNGDWDWRCVSYDEAQQARQFTAQLTVHESYEGDALSDEKMKLQFTLPDGISLKETFSADGQVHGLFLYYGAEHLGRISVYKDANAEFFNSKAEPWPMTSDFADLSAEMNRGCYRHITEYPAKEFWPFERGIAYYLNLDGYCTDVWVVLERSKPEQQELVEELLSSLSVSKAEPQEALTKTARITAANYTDLEFEPVIEMLVPEKSSVTDERVYFGDDVEGPYAFGYSTLDNGKYLSINDCDFSVGWTRGFRWIQVNGKEAFVEKRESMLDRSGPELPLYLYRYTICPNGKDGCLTFAFVSETADFDLAIAEQREFVQSIRLLKLQANEKPIPEEALTAQQKELVNIVESLDILGLTVNESMSEEQKGLFFLWLIDQEEYVNADKWKNDNGTYKISLRDIEWTLGERTTITEINPTAAFPYHNYDEKTQYLYLNELGGYGGARAHGLLSIEEQGNRTTIVLGSYDMATFWNEPPVYTLQETITAEFEFQWGEWCIVDMDREKIEQKGAKHE